MLLDLRSLLEAEEAGGTVNGTLSATLGALTLSSTGQVIIDGDLAATLGTLTLSSAGQVVIDGDLAATLADLTLSSAGQLVIDADEGTTLEALTLSATGTVEIAAALSATLGDLTLASEGAGEALTNTDRGGDGFPRSSAIRQRRRARSLKRNLAYLEALDARTPVIERVVSKAIAREAVAKAEAVGLIPDDMPPQWVPNIVTVPVADVNDKALAVAAVIRELARRAAEDEEDVEMLLLAA